MTFGQTHLWNSQVNTSYQKENAAADKRNEEVFLVSPAFLFDLCEGDGKIRLLLMRVALEV